MVISHYIVHVKRNGVTNGYIKHIFDTHSLFNYFGQWDGIYWCKWMVKLAKNHNNYVYLYIIVVAVRRVDRYDNNQMFLIRI